jgi:hypothetical protein
MPLNYGLYVSQISNLLTYTSTETIFTTMLPGMIDYAEQRIYRELDLLYTQVTDATTTASSGNRNFAVPSATGNPYIIVDNINIITPSTALSSNGTRNQLTPVSREFLDIAYPSGQTVTGVPEFWAMASNTEILFGPSPDAGYTVEVIGVQRPSPLSSANSSTILTQYVPDLFIAASMVFGMGFQKDFSAQGDNPQGGVSWEAQYKTLFQSASVEQARAKFQSEGWTSDSPSPIATPKRV